MESWILKFNDWNPKEERLREALFTLGNGYFATRGSGEEGRISDFHYPGTYLSGGYNRLKTLISNRLIQNEDLVNWPNWPCISFRFPEENWFFLEEVKIINISQELDLKKGVHSRYLHFQDPKGRESILKSFRFISMDNPHIGGVKWTLSAVNWSSTVEIKSWADGNVKNQGVKRYEGLKNEHFSIRRKLWESDDTFILETESNQSHIMVTQAFRNEVFLDGKKIKGLFQALDEEGIIGIKFQIQIGPERSISLEKVMTLFTSKDKAIVNPTYEALRLLSRSATHDALLKRHVKQWDRIWKLCDIELPGKDRENRILRLHIFHLLQTVSLKSIDLDVGVPARGLHGEAYRGHIFWDEIFIFPFLNLRVPELTRSLLMYRYRRLDEARVNADKSGFRGAMFPWQSGSNGEEEGQKLHLNPVSGKWTPDHTLRQRHINATILYNIWQYYQATDDKEFLSLFGIEMALEISRFWVSLLKWNSKRARYEILNVVGPDEFHTQYPGSEEEGINNNAYTNYMASWSIRTTVNLYLSLAEDRRKEILEILELDEAELGRWIDISKNVYLPLKEDGIIAQFDGFDELKELDFTHYSNKYGNIQRIDRILDAEGDSVNDYKVNKQSDVLMLFYLFSYEDLKEGFKWLNYPFEENDISKNINYHLALTTNGSTLSRIVHSWVLSKYDSEKSWEWFDRALETDMADIQGGTTSEGIHLGAMSGTVDLVQRCFTGLEVRNETLWINPRMPSQLKELRFLIHFRGHSLKLSFSEKKLSIKVRRSWSSAAKIGVCGKVYDLVQGSEFHFSLCGEEDGKNDSKERSLQ